MTPLPPLSRGDPIFIAHPLGGFTEAEFLSIDNREEWARVVVRARDHRFDVYKSAQLCDITPATPEACEIVSAARAAHEEGLRLLADAHKLARTLPRLHYPKHEKKRERA